LFLLIVKKKVRKRKKLGIPLGGEVFLYKINIEVLNSNITECILFNTKRERSNNNVVNSRVSFLFL
jgi:hypothetical protein